MTQPLVSIGVPVFRGVGLVEDTLRVVLDQTYRNIEVIISVDGADHESAEACRRFLSDERVRMTVQDGQLGWAANTQWLIEQHRGDFFIYQQQDDGMTSNYVETLVAAAEAFPDAAICYAEMHVTDRTSQWVDRSPSLCGAPVQRALAHVERLRSIVFRGLIRSSALRDTAGVQSSDFESYGAEHSFAADLALKGDFRLVDGATYYKRVHERGTHLKWFAWSPERRRAAWATLAARILGVMIPGCTTLSERWHVLLSVADRFTNTRGGQRSCFGQVSDEDRAAQADVIDIMLEACDARWLPTLPALLETTPAQLRSELKRHLRLA